MKRRQCTRIDPHYAHHLYLPYLPSNQYRDFLCPGVFRNLRKKLKAQLKELDCGFYLFTVTLGFPQVAYLSRSKVISIQGEGYDEDEFLIALDSGVVYRLKEEMLYKFGVKQ